MDDGLLQVRDVGQRGARLATSEFHQAGVSAMCRLRRGLKACCVRDGVVHTLIRRDTANPCGSELARDSGLTVNIDFD
ncbi:hypothetical protein D3C85_1517220 [compost metagenome]